MYDFQLYVLKVSKITFEVIITKLSNFYFAIIT